MRALIIDDETPNRAVLRRYLETYCPDVQVAGEAAAVAPALDFIAAHDPEVLFLDIEMPFANGFDLLERLPAGRQPNVIFVTAYEQYALRALRMSAAHYLLKPIDIDELIEAVARVKERLDRADNRLLHQTLLDNLRRAGGDSVERLALPLIDGLEIVQAPEINYLLAADNFTEFHLLDGRKLLICRKLKYYEDILCGAGFHRIHRSTIVNLARVRRYHKGKGGAVTLEDGSTLEVAAARKAAFLSALA